MLSHKEVNCTHPKQIKLDVLSSVFTQRIVYRAVVLKLLIEVKSDEFKKNI
jgi:hypothetical protein